MNTRREHIAIAVIITGLLALVIIPKSCYAQWVNINARDDFGNTTGEQYARSPWTKPANGTGEQLALLTTDCENFVLWSENKTIDMMESEVKLFTLEMYDIAVELNGHQTTWRGVLERSVDFMLFDEENLVPILQNASTLRMIVPSARYGNLLYTFDMRQSKSKIANTCNS